MFSYNALSVLQLQRGKRRNEENNKPKRKGRMKVKKERKKSFNIYVVQHDTQCGLNE